MTEFTLGQKVVGGPRLRRKFKREGRKEWEPYESGHQTIEGIFIGWRTYSNGKSEYEDSCGYIFTPDKYFKVALIVPHIRANPIPVMFDTLKPSGKVESSK